MLKNWCFWIVVLEKTLECPLDCRKISKQSILKEISPEYSLEDWCWSWNSNTLATWCEELTHCRRPWCWERLKAGGEGDNRGRDGWMASLTWWTWVWVISGSWWWTGKPGILQSMESQRIGHDWTTELNWLYANHWCMCVCVCVCVCVCLCVCERERQRWHEGLRDELIVIFSHPLRWVATIPIYIWDCWGADK